MTRNVLGAIAGLGIINVILVIVVTAHASLVSLLVAGLATLLEGGVVWARQRTTDRHIQLLTKKIVGIQEEVAPAHVLLPPNDPLYDLAMQINHLQTQQRQLLRRRETQRQEFVTILDYLPVGVMVIDRYRKVELANPAMAEFLQHPIESRRHPFAQDIQQFELARLINNALTTKQRQQQILTLPGTPVERTVDVQAIYTESSQDYFQVLLLVYDVTEVYAVERMQMDFVSNASHELKTPVTAISGFAKTLLAGARQDPEKLTEFLTIIDEQSDRLVELIDDVLAISHLEADSGVSLRSLPLKELVDQQIRLLRPLAAVSEIQFDNQVPDNLVIKTDERRMEQILKNLLSNAVKYNRRQGQILIQGSRETNEWEIRIQDTGIGISSRDQSRVFERFYRAEASHSNQVVSGTGLGLAIVKELVSSLNGTIQLTSQTGAGTTVKLTFKQ